MLDVTLCDVAKKTATALTHRRGLGMVALLSRQWAFGVEEQKKNMAMLVYAVCDIGKHWSVSGKKEPIGISKQNYWPMIAISIPDEVAGIIIAIMTVFHHAEPCRLACWLARSTLTPMLHKVGHAPHHILCPSPLLSCLPTQRFPLLECANCQVPRL